MSDLPCVGDVFMVDTLVYANGDHAVMRPVVVVRAPRSQTDYLTVIQRSSSATDYVGVDHPADVEMQLDKPGRWVVEYQRAARWDEFEEGAQYVGSLPGEWLNPLIKLWEQA